MLDSALLVTQEGLGLPRGNAGSDPSCQSSSDEALLEEAGDRETKQSSKSDLTLQSLILLSAVLFFFSGRCLLVSCKHIPPRKKQAKSLHQLFVLDRPMWQAARYD